MGDETTNADFPENEQRAAVCYRQWREGKAIESTGTDDVQVDSTEGADIEVTCAKGHVFLAGPDMEDSQPIPEWMCPDCFDEWKAKNGNALKAISQTDDELRVGNYIVLFGTRDLEGHGSPRVNPDGTKGEYFTPETDFESQYTKSGAVFVDWEHGHDYDEQNDIGPAGEVLGVVDWKTARRDKMGLWVERILNRRSAYVKWVESLIEDGLIGSSSEAVPDEVQKAADGAILRWPVKRDTFTVEPMEFRNMKEFGPNQIQAFKALGIKVPDDTAPEPEQEPEASPEATPDLVGVSAVDVARARARAQRILIELTEV